MIRQRKQGVVEQLLERGKTDEQIVSARVAYKGLMEVLAGNLLLHSHGKCKLIADMNYSEYREYLFDLEHFQEL